MLDAKLAIFGNVLSVIEKKTEAKPNNNFILHTMKKFLLFLLLTVLTAQANAQVDSKYLQGAIPETDGKVVFSKNIKINSANISDDKLFDLMNSWTQKNYGSSTNPNQRILLSDAANKTIVCKGEKDLVFKKMALSLDKTTMTYQLLIRIVGGECSATVRSIKYDYYDKGSGKDYYTAEELISDKVALNGEKLNRYYDKFRIHTVDSIAALFDSIDVYLNGEKRRKGAVEAQSSKEISTIPLTPLTASSHPIGQSADTPTLAGFKQVTADKIPGNIIKLLTDATLITSGTDDQTNVMTASWGGLGVFWGKPVAFCFLGATRYSITTMDKGDAYTISFYTEAYKDVLQYCGSRTGRDEDKIKGSGLTPIKLPSGATAFTEAWMILECKKMIAQPLSHDAIADKESEVAKRWAGKDLHKMYIGEILNVWIK